MTQLEDPIVAVLIEEFDEAVESLCEDNASRQDSIALVKQLCDLSRDAKFNLGSTSFSNPDQRTMLAESLLAGVAKIKAFFGGENSLPAEVVRYCDNLSWRAQRIQEGF